MIRRLLSPGFILIFVVSLLPLLNLLNSGLPVSHDGQDHIVRIANFYQSLREGNLVPRWAGNLNWGYGHPILMFLYPLPSYSASLFHSVGISIVDSYKLVMAISFTLSGIFMYLWLISFLGEKAAIIGAVFYLFAPYRFIDLYVRGAFGEHFAFLFLPLVLLFIHRLSQSKNIKERYLNVLLGSFSIAGLILSHNAVSLIFLPFMFFYLLYLISKNRSRSLIITSLITISLGFLLSFFFWFPAFFEGKYTLRDIVTAGEYAKRFVEFKSLIFSNWSFGGSGQFSTQIGIPHLIATILSVFITIKTLKNKKSRDLLMIGSLAIIVISIFLMLKESSFIWENASIIQKLQFPWRFLTITTLLTSILGALLVKRLNPRIILVFLIGILTVVITIPYWQSKEYREVSKDLLNGVYKGTTDTGESAPIWSVRYMENLPAANIEFISGEGEIREVKRISTLHEYVIDVPVSSRVRENTLYFPGWKVYDNGKLIENVEFQDPKNRGIITFNLEPGIHNIIIKFEDTKVRHLSEIISLLTILGILFSSTLLFVSSKIFKRLR